MASYKIIYNPVSKDYMIQKFRSRVEEVLKEEGIDYSLVSTTKPRDAIRLAAEAKKEGFTRIIAFGGDGTSHEVLNGAVKSGLPVGFLPFGSGNDLAAGLGYIPDNIEHAIDVLVSGKKVKLSGAKYNGVYSFNVIDVGVSSIVSKLALKRFKWIHGRKKYTFLALKTIPFYKLPKTKIVVDGVERELRLVLTAIGRGQTFGSGMNVLPPARFSDDKLTMLIARDMSTLTMLKMFPKFTEGKHLEMKEVEVLKANKIEIYSERTLPVEAEGEIVGDTPAVIENAKEIVDVIIPKEWDLSNRSQMVLLRDNKMKK